MYCFQAPWTRTFSSVPFLFLQNPEMEALLPKEGKQKGKNTGFLCCESDFLRVDILVWWLGKQVTEPLHLCFLICKMGITQALTPGDWCEN